jgi:hypothetical protein
MKLLLEISDDTTPFARQVTPETVWRFTRDFCQMVSNYHAVGKVVPIALTPGVVMELTGAWLDPVCVCCAENECECEGERIGP